MTFVDEQGSQHRRWNIRADNREPKDRTQHGDHDRKSGEWMSQQTIQGLLPRQSAVTTTARDAALGDSRGLTVNRLGDPVVQVLRQLPSQLPRLF